MCWAGGGGDEDGDGVRWRKFEEEDGGAVVSVKRMPLDECVDDTISKPPPLSTVENRG